MLIYKKNTTEQKLARQRQSYKNAERGQVNKKEIPFPP
jgi:hypothetical protein